MARRIELMAPAGSFESLTAAIQAGADSVYFGVEQLNMRVKASSNFTLGDIPRVMAMCRQNGVKAYLTINTIIYTHDITIMKSIIDIAIKNKVNAVIASDQAVMTYARRVGMPVHISTQANVSNIDSLEFYSAYADAVVLARELTLKQVSAITKEIRRRKITGPSEELMKVEVFGHGALCMAISGKCYLSLHSAYSSANRGACVQNCRRSYVVTDKEQGIEFEVDNQYIMSAKDLCTIDFLDQLIGSGASILKLEGRGRSADYVHTVTKCYREAIDACYMGLYSKELVKYWKEQLSTVFNRGFWDGYYLGRTIGEWSHDYGSKATKKKVYLGRGLKYFEYSRAAEFRIEAQSLSVGNEILITGPTTGVVQTRINEIRVNDIPTDTVHKGDIISIPLPDRVRPADKLYKLVDV
ncbi:peptidase U32 family protein [Desertivirga xinjiangensis]|uniref:peptidase U32 family protein n=1 Tax=Desertivirga xinjiangensis TaxID=539206 RepID=UPI002108CB3B|nr:peptidase U32 family protein [Pedobacter xinjiangensis]